MFGQDAATAKEKTTSKTLKTTQKELGNAKKELAKAKEELLLLKKEVESGASGRGRSGSSRNETRGDSMERLARKGAHQARCLRAEECNCAEEQREGREEEV